jgi:hypothetical protein
VRVAAKQVEALSVGKDFFGGPQSDELALVQDGGAVG